jgi:hypothetical protein
MCGFNPSLREGVSGIWANFCGGAPVRIRLPASDQPPICPAVITRVGWFDALLPNLGPLGSRVFRVAQVGCVGFTG